jgi:hypothetical protein
MPNLVAMSYTGHADPEFRGTTARTDLIRDDASLLMNRHHRLVSSY